MRPEHWVYTIPLRIRSLFHREQLDQDLEEELRDHLERRTADYIARGMSPEEAHRAAIRELGGIEQAKERCRDTRRVNWAYDFAQDAEYAVRQFRKNPGYAALAILALALGIGANTAMFTVIDTVLLRALPFRDGDRIVDIEGVSGGYQQSISWLDYRTIHDQCRQLEDVAGYAWEEAVILGGAGAQKVAKLTVTSDLFDLLGVQPVLGRGFVASDTQAGAPPVAVLSNRLWRDEFRADPQILGRQLRVAGVSANVVGVMPAGFRFPVVSPFGETNGDLVAWFPFQPSPEMLKDRGLEAMWVIGRLKAGASPAEAQAELAVVNQRITAQGAGDLHFYVKPYRDVITKAVRPALLALTGALLLVLLIACINVANLQLARHLARRYELAVRAALGAGRRRLVRQLIAEGAVVAAAGALVALGLTSVLLFAVHRLPPDFIPRTQEIRFRVSVFAMLAMFAVLATILSSVVPALLATHTNPEEVLREGSGGSTEGRKRSRLSQFMVVCEVALSAVLLVSTGLLFHTLYNLEHIQFGFDLDRVTTFTATPADALGDLGFTTVQRKDALPASESIVTRVYQPLEDRLRRVPGVTEVAISAWAPFDHNTMWVNFVVPTHPEIGKRGVVSQICIVSSGYARAMGTPLVAGRMFADSDTATSPLVAVVNEAFARRAFPGENPVGQQIVDPARTYTILGVLADARQHDLTHTPDPEVLMAYLQMPTTGFGYTVLVASGTNFIVRTRGDVHLTNTIRQIFRQSAPDMAMDHFRTLRGALDEATFNQRLGLYLTGSFAGVAILMVLTGLYGALSQLVGQRRREFGIRMALGASGSTIQAMVLRRAWLLATSGLSVGLLASLAVGRLLRAFLFGVKPTDGATYLAVAIVLLAVSIAAALIPARKAARTDFRAALQ